MQLALRHFSKVRASIAPVLFSGTRMDAASGQIKRIAEAEYWPPERRKHLDEICLQLGEITKTRNDLLHYAAFEFGDHYRVSNALHAHIAGRIRDTKITPEILDAMSVDLVTIMAQIEILRTGAKAPEEFREMKMPPERAWLYKPEVSQGPGEKRRPSRRKPRTRPPTSKA